MDVEDFLKSNKPASGSRLAPFLNDLRRLRGLGYSLKQVQDYLAAQEIHVSVQNISAYLHRQQEHKPLNPTGQTLHQDTSTTLEGANNAKDDGEDRGLTRRERGHKVAEKYLNDETLSPLTKRIMEKEQLRKQLLEKKDESNSD